MSDWHSLSTLSSGIASLVAHVSALVWCIQIDLSLNNIGAEGAKPLADALRVTASLTQLNVTYNYLNRGGNGVELLRDAVREREGFKLIADE